MLATIGVVATAVTIAANAGIAVADLRHAGFVLANSAELGLPSSQLPVLGGLKAAGAVGLLLGLLGVPVLGVAAAAGLVAFFTGALAVHVRAGVVHNLYFPGAFWLLALASLAFAILR